MAKKEAGRKARLGKAGQVTVFIILGIVMLAIFLFMMKVVKDSKLGGLEQERERLMGKVLSQEGLRIYVEECLEDKLKEGLRLIGRQGGLWEGDEGGEIAFIDGETGILYGGEKVFYGITDTLKNYQLYSPLGLYPCKKGDEPAFCQYEYPGGSAEVGDKIKFGERRLDDGVLENDLERFLANQTISCMEEYLEAELSLDVVVEPGDLEEMEVKMLFDGFSIKVEYPLTVSGGGKTYFHLATFDFFYGSDFNKFWRGAIELPLKLDWSLIDFSYDETTLGMEEFVYLGFDASGQVEEKTRKMWDEEYGETVVSLDIIGDVNGDDVFEFTSGMGKVIENEEYVFRFARQNRPPALDYVGREECLIEDDLTTSGVDESLDSYDYLVIPGMSSGVSEVFAGEVVSYVNGGGEVGFINIKTDSGKALGKPDISSDPEGFVSLGKEGEIVLKFKDGYLAGDGGITNDLMVYEIGGEAEDVIVWISEGGVDWIKVGPVTGTNGINIDLATIPDIEQKLFAYVKLVDSGTNEYNLDTPGADIDAVEAINYVKADDLSSVSIVLEARDPDEDEVVKYSFEDPSWVDSTSSPDAAAGLEQQSLYIFENTPSSDVLKTPGKYEITVKAEDEHGKIDQQRVRILVDNNMKTDVWIDLPYQFNEVGSTDLVGYETKFVFSGSAPNDLKTYVVSKEDPVFIVASFPKDSATGSDPVVTLDYKTDSKTFAQLSLPNDAVLDKGGGCFSLPWTNLYHDCMVDTGGEVNHNLDDYAGEIEDAWVDNTYGYFLQEGGGELTITAEKTYCSEEVSGGADQTDSETIKVVVMQCLPHRNETHPFAYVPDDNKEHWKWKKTVDVLGGVSYEEDPLANPFLATHKCCGYGGNVLDPGSDCFVNPKEGCYALPPGFEAGKKGYVLMEEYAQCDGERGNLCGEKSGLQYQLYNNEMRCGKNEAAATGMGGEPNPECKHINSACWKELAFSLIEDIGWCSGEMGCQNLCDDPVMWKGAKAVGKVVGDSLSNWEINEEVINKKIKNNGDMKLEMGLFCGCSTDGALCDSDWDGIFDGSCQSDGSCKP